MIVIIGAGICGLATAYELSRRGERAVVLERGQPFAEQSHAEPRDEREPDQAPERRQADQPSACCSRESDMGQRMTRECLAPHHQKISDKSGHHGDDPGGREGIDHKIIFKHV